MERFVDWLATVVLSVVVGVSAYYLAVVEFALDGVDWKYGPLVVGFLTAAAVGRIIRRVLPKLEGSDGLSPMRQKAEGPDPDAVRLHAESEARRRAEAEANDPDAARRRAESEARRRASGRG